MASGQDHPFRTFALPALVIGLLLLLGLVPPFTIHGAKIKRVNILSDLWDREEADAGPLAEYADTAFTAESLTATTAESILKTQNAPEALIQNWDVSPRGVTASTGESLAEAVALYDVVVADMEEFAHPAAAIEDFGPEASGMEPFYAALRSKGRPIRIAVLGDSFIEADIITADLREQLQTLCGGRGVGFVPFSSPLAQYRSTVRQTFEKWQTYNVIKKNSAPAAVRDKFFVSGLVCIPSEGAKTRIEGTEFRRHLTRCSVARLLFTNAASSRLDVTINDSIRHRFTPPSSPQVQQINLNGDIRSIEVKVTSPEGFTGYGVVFEDPAGVTVDNYSVRSNSGMALFGTNGAVNTQIGKLRGYDLIVLQYGLNAMSPDIRNYNAYTAQLVRIAAYVRECFPGAAVMLMSVGDRSTLDRGEYVTMPAAKAMLEAQRKAAQQAGTAFWNTFQAMGGEKSMVRFVENKWASKDYTHIGYPGGRQIATEMVRSLMHGLQEYNSQKPDSAQSAWPDMALPVNSIGAVPIAPRPDTLRVAPGTLPALPPADTAKTLPEE